MLWTRKHTAVAAGLAAAAAIGLTIGLTTGGSANTNLANPKPTPTLAVPSPPTGTDTTSSAQPAGDTSSPVDGTPLKPVKHDPFPPRPNTPLVQELDAEFASSEATTANWAWVAQLKVPPPVPSKEFPAIPDALRQDPDTYAKAFVTELLTIDFAHQSRQALLEWAVSESAPYTMPGVPAAAIPKTAYGGVVYTPSAVPNAEQWATYAAEHATMSVDGVKVYPNADWVLMTGQGWVPMDPNMKLVNVAFLEKISIPGKEDTVNYLYVQLGVATATYHHGLGFCFISRALPGW